MVREGPGERGHEAARSQAVSGMNSSVTQTHVRTTSSTITFADRWDHFLARWGVNRGGHRVEPGLYALGNPSADSPVFVTANYTLSFDALRSALGGTDGYILVLNTYGINVWCAAGKGTFGTDELVSQIETSRLEEVVRHRALILPQLGAPGVAAHEVKQRSGFNVEYGPIRADELPEYLRTRRATSEMRQVRFGLADRLVLIPVELVHVLLPMAIVAVGLYFAGGILISGATMAAIVSGAVLFPILLPWLPTRDFSSKGFVLGALTALPFALLSALGGNNPLWRQVGGAVALMLALAPVTAYLTLNFTGSTTFTSRSGVRREMFTYIPIMAGMFGSGIILAVVIWVIRAVGGS